jgi:hypothetical protein
VIIAPDNRYNLIDNPGRNVSSQTGPNVDVRWIFGGYPRSLRRVVSCKVSYYDANFQRL